MSQLLCLCAEILHGIFQEVNPPDLSSLSKTCRLLNIFIKNDGLLWKELYFRNYVSQVEVHCIIELSLRHLQLGPLPPQAGSDRALLAS
jgi:hypothetical protein